MPRHRCDFGRDIRVYHRLGHDLGRIQLEAQLQVSTFRPRLSSQTSKEDVQVQGDASQLTSLLESSTEHGL